MRRGGNRGRQPGKVRNSPSDWRARIRRLTDAIDRTVAGETTHDLDALYQQLRLARAMLADKTGIEQGSEFLRPIGKLESGEIIVGRARARQTGERMPVRLEVPHGP